MTEAIEKVRRARAEAEKVQQDLDQRIRATRSRLDKLCKTGPVPFDEAFESWRRAFEAYADTGREELDHGFGEFTRPHEHPLTGAINTHRQAHAPFQARSDGRTDHIGAIVAHLNRDVIIEAARAWLKEKCKDSDVPAAEKRKTEAQRITDELQALQAERDDMRDQMAGLVQQAPSERTMQAARRAEAQGHVDRLNAQAREQVGRG